MRPPLSMLGPEGFLALHEGWELAASAPGQCANPGDLASLAWRPALVPGTVAQSLDLPLEADPRLDEQDWWYRTTFPRPEDVNRHRLRFEGLATRAEVWLNGQRVLESCTMFRPQACEVSLRERNELVICFRALAPLLAQRRPRPRWKTALVAHQNLRWVRTSLLGRIPGWTPALPPVGPWRPLGLELHGPLQPTTLQLRPWAEGPAARLQIEATFTGPGPAEARLELGERSLPLVVEAIGDELRVSGDLRLEDVPLWFPHTHGEPNLLPCALVLGPRRFELGAVGFRSLTLDGGLRFAINGRPLFVRGACWTANEMRGLDGSPQAMVEALDLALAAGINMLRVIGTMAYPSDAFLAACDARGLLLWQDFMFANMDYPFDDPAFRAEVEAEVECQLHRLAPHACIAALCGGSEIEQQAAMTGLPPEDWCHPFLAEALPALCERILPGLPCFPSTPTGGALPFHTATGLTHYYGVGAYLRGLGEVRRARVRFTPECLGFSNVPDDETMTLVNGGARPVPHHPRWKASVPRDQGAGWDFEDVRDHYLKALFRVDPLALRYADIDRYWALSRLVTGELMLRTYAEWRRPGSTCGGGLVWFYQDLRPGGGWGVIDSERRPKAAYWFLKRAWASQAVLVTDEGLDGLDLHVHNERAETLEATVELDCLQDGRATPLGAQELQVPPFSAQSLQGDALVGRFTDLVHAYRFGPPKHDVVIARLRRTATGEVLHEDVFFPGSMDLPLQHGAQVSLAAEAEGPGTVCLTLTSDRFLQGVSLACEEYRPDDDHFHLAPGITKRVRFRALPGPEAPFKVHVQAVNAREIWTVRNSVVSDQ